MGIHAILVIDDDRWAKHPYGVEFDDNECNNQFRKIGLNSREACYKVIERAKAAGFEVDDSIEEKFY